MKTTKHMKKFTIKPQFPKQQQGFAILMYVLVLMSVLTMVSIQASKSSTLEVKMATNNTEREKALGSAKSTVRKAWMNLANNFDVTNYTNHCTGAGHFNLQETAEVCNGSDKTLQGWSGIATRSTNWGWTGSDSVLLDNNLESDAAFLEQGTSNNPMNLIATPRYISGIYEPVMIPGTENLFCIPVSIISKGGGSTESASSMVEAHGIPESGCEFQTY